jgi:drug/metabolite transporter (DMT)-like permease
MTTARRSASDPPLVLQTDLRRGTFWMLLSIAGFTFNALVVGRVTADHSVSVWTAMTLRGLIGLGMVFALAPQELRRDWTQLFTHRLMLERGIIGSLGIAAFYYTLAGLGTGKATLINNSWALFASIMAAWTIREPLGWVRGGGLILTLLGLGLLVGVGWDVLASIHLMEGLALLGAILSAIAVIAIRQLSAMTSSVMIYASQCVYCLLLGLPFALQEVGQLTASGWGWMLAASLAVGLAQITMTEGFRYLTVASGGAYQMALPLVITAFSVCLFGEHFTMAQLIGGFIMVAGTAVTVLRRT